MMEPIDSTKDTTGEVADKDTGTTQEEQLQALSGRNLIKELSPELLERMVQQTIADRTWGKKHYETELEPKYILRQKAFRSDKADLKARFPDLEQVIELSDSSVQDTVESIMPSLMRIFHSAEKVLNLVGVTEDDDMQAETMEDVIDWQLNRKNNFWLTSYDWLKIMLIENFSVIKVWWKREETFKRYEVMFDDEELMALKNDPKVKIESDEITNPGDPASQMQAVHHVTYTLRKRTANYPVVEGMPNCEFYYDPDCRSIDEANFVIHHKPVSVSYLRDQERRGIFVNIDAAKEGAGTVKKSQYDAVLNPTARQTKREETDPGRKEITLYECYEKISMPLTEGGADDSLVDLIITLANDTPVRVEVNTMGAHPFIDISAVRDPHQTQAHRGMAELVREIQDLRTVLLLQMALNTICNNDRQAFVHSDKLVDPNELRNNDKVIQTNDDPSRVVSWTPQEPFAPQVMELMEYCHQLLENRVGVTRYNQGSDANSLNKTLGGLNMIMQAANQRIELIARICAETGYSKLFRRLIYLNQTYIDEEQVLRVTNNQKIVKPDDLAGEMDIIVNSGIGTGTKQAEIGSLQFLLTCYPQLVQAGVATRPNVAFAMGKLIENMGFKNIGDFIRRPEEIEAEEQQQAAQQNAIANAVGAATGNGGPPQAGGAGPTGKLDPAIIAELLAKLSGRPPEAAQGA